MSAPSRRDTSRDLYFLSNPKLWETWPLLPLVRRHADGNYDCGLMYDTRGAANMAGLRATVFMSNLFEIPRTLDEFLQLPHETFDNFEEVVAAGWRVD